jgi:hypothetical protein
LPKDPGVAICGVDPWRHGELARAIAILIVFADLGLAFGYLGGYIEFYNDMHHGGTGRECEFEWLALPGLPGALIAQSRQEWDYQLGEAWYLDKHSMALWNSLCYTILGLHLAVWMYLTTRCGRGRIVTKDGPM